MRRYIHKYGKWAVDEKCQCSHGRAEHGTLAVSPGSQAEGKDGLGGCRVADCRCRKFRRHLWIFEGEPQGVSRPTRPTRT